MAQTDRSRDGVVVFRDAAGVEWTVEEIESPTLPPRLLSLLSEERRRGGWLVFEADHGERRRLSPVPSGWRTLSDAELEKCCARGDRVPPAPARRAEDGPPAE